MDNIAILGGFFGDEAKGSFTHMLSSKYDWVIRTSGGDNCGHTIYRDGKKYVHHLVPCLNLNGNAKGFLGSGMVINPKSLLEEITYLQKDFENFPSRIYVDPDAFVVLDKHIEEDKQKNKHIGSTNKGISPAYTDKVSRKGLKIIDLLNSKDESLMKLKDMGVHFKYSMELMDEFKNSSLLFEGAQSILLDPNFGTYPFVTSGDCALNGVYSSGFASVMPKKVYGVVKCYSTRVGNGPFPTEIFGDEADLLRERGGEYGATTGRPRRVGWLDLPALKYAATKGGLTDLIITKLDILSGMDTIPIASEYDFTPVSGSSFFNATPTYTRVRGWKDPKDMSQISDFVRYISEYVGLPVSYISCGTSESDIIKL